jgi:hypothetical protein
MNHGEQIPQILQVTQFRFPLSITTNARSCAAMTGIMVTYLHNTEFLNKIQESASRCSIPPELTHQIHQTMLYEST